MTPAHRKHPDLYNYDKMVGYVAGELMTDGEIAQVLGCHPTDVTAARRAFGIIAMRPQGQKRTVRSLEQIDHFLRREQCYMAKARRLMAGERVDPACRGGV